MSEGQYKLNKIIVHVILFLLLVVNPVVNTILFIRYVVPMVQPCDQLFDASLKIATESNTTMDSAASLYMLSLGIGCQMSESIQPYTGRSLALKNIIKTAFT